MGGSRNIDRKVRPKSEEKDLRPERDYYLSRRNTTSRTTKTFPQKGLTDVPKDHPVTLRFSLPWIPYRTLPETLGVSNFKYEKGTFPFCHHRGSTHPPTARPPLTRMNSVSL